MSHVIGADIGGTNLRVALYREAPFTDTTPVAAIRERVGDARGPDAVSDRLAAMIRGLLADAGIDGPVPVGIGFAGMMRGEDGTVAVSPHLRWRDVPFGAMMRQRLDGAVVEVDNDVNVITYGEWKAGAGRGADDILAVFVGTGIGAGIVARGRLVPGASGCAAEIGHTKVVFGDDALPCACGLRGCIEAYAGGTYVQQRIRRELAAGARSRAVELAGSADAVNPGHLDAAAAEGDDYALGVYEQIAPMLGAVLANAVTLLNPARLILGGGMLSRTPVLRAQVLTAFDIAANPPAREAVEVVDAALGDDAGLVGGALLASAGG